VRECCSHDEIEDRSGNRCDVQVNDPFDDKASIDQLPMLPESLDRSIKRLFTSASLFELVECRLLELVHLMTAHKDHRWDGLPKIQCDLRAGH